MENMEEIKQILKELENSNSEKLIREKLTDYNIETISVCLNDFSQIENQKFKDIVNELIRVRTRRAATYKRTILDGTFDIFLNSLSLNELYELNSDYRPKTPSEHELFVIYYQVLQDAIVAKLAKIEKMNSIKK